MRAATPKVLASAYTRLAPIFAASLARGAYDLQVAFSRIPSGDDITMAVIFRGTTAEARQEVAMIREAAARIGFKLQGGVQDLMDVPAHVANWPEDGHLIVMTWNHKTALASPARSTIEARA